MSLISSNKKENDLEESNTKSRNKLVKSSSTTVNNYSLYEKYIGKTNTSKNNISKQKESNTKKNNSSSSKFNNSKRVNSHNSFYLSNYEGESKVIKKNIYAFNKIMENYLQQKNIELLQRKKNLHVKSVSNRNIISESSSNYSNKYNTNKKLFSGNSLMNHRMSERKNESMNVINSNKIKLTRNKNLSMREIDNFSNFSNVKSLKHMNNNFRKQNLFPKKFLENNITNKKITSPELNYESDINNNNTFNYNNNNKCENKKNKSNSTRNTDCNNSKIIEIGKKYDLFFNSESQIYDKKNNNKIISNSINKGKNNNTLKSRDSEVTKPNTLNEKIEKKDDDLEGPEIIHFSLVELIQKGRKKMEEISFNFHKK